METRANSFITGLGSLFLIIGLMAFVAWTSKSEWNKARSCYTIHVEHSVTGLLKESIVNYQGVPVGIVKKIKLDMPHRNRINVTIALKDSIRLRQGTVASLEMQGLTGTVSVRLQGGGDPSAPLLKALPFEPYPIIPFQPSSFDSLVTSAPEVMHKLGTLLDRLSLFFDEKNTAHFSHMLASLEKLAGQAPHTLHSLTQTAQAWRGVARETQQMLGDNRQNLKEFTGSALPELRDLVQKSREMVEGLHRTTEEFSRSPLRFLRGPVDEGYVLE